jgi:cytochrome c oxidase subunit 2
MREEPMKTGERVRLALVATIAAVLLGATLTASFAEEPAKVVQITAKRFEYSPREVRLKKGVPVVLELTSLDRLHGFSCPDFKIRADIEPGKTARVAFTPDRTGTFPFHCDIFCGDGHEDMSGKFIVEE